MKKLKKGFTTGSCATAAAKAAAYMLITQTEASRIKIITPVGLEYEAQVHKAYFDDNSASCEIIKESCDDPDITAGIHICARVERVDSPKQVYITGGEGIGIVTRPGLDQPVGNYAINSGPRKTIEKEVTALLDEAGYKDSVLVTISAPMGREIALKTFNPHMGIEGGISIIGTTGIVEPMSTDALLDTIKADISMQYAEGCEVCIMAPGNYGVTFLMENYNIPERNIVVISNFVGDAIRMCKDKGFKKILLCSHIGKLIKVSGGIMNTHSKYSDDRMKLMCAAYEEACIRISTGTDANIDVSMQHEDHADVLGQQDNLIDEKTRREISEKILSCVSTSAALDILNEIDFVKPVCDVIIDKAMHHLKQLAGDEMEIDCILYENRYKELARRKL